MSEQPEKIISDGSDVGAVSEKPEYQPEQIRWLTERMLCPSEGLSGPNGAWTRATGVSGANDV
ncbi:hypothetical protein LQI03_002701 [Salmonella enterica]|nr:hypothetical protein [Salmonella enterica]ECR4969881.1 hypothetical protein [Salmonella enterica]EEF8439332.1 hypothetical protein [Salmonella enterica]EFO8728103.1 hypothetical protein [Salmonella enterica]EHK1334324.1 hypothetical protein [Salmonella enterica]